MTERADIVRDIYQSVEASLARRIPSWKALPASDPSRIFMEAVAECAADLYQRVRPETEGLFERLPEFARFPRASAKPVEGMVQIRRSERGPAILTLPAGTPLFADTAEGERRFETTEAIPLYSGGDLESLREGTYLYFRLPDSATPGRTTIYVHPFGSADLKELPFECFTGSNWEPARSHVTRESGPSLIHLDYDHTRLAKAEIGGTPGFQFRIALSPQQDPPALFLNAAPVHEVALDEAIEIGIALSIPGQTVTLPIVPLEANFTLRIEGDRDPWSSTTNLWRETHAAKIFRYDPSLRNITFGDGKCGAIPSPRGAKILLTKIRHLGSSKSLERSSIGRLETDLADVTGVEQPLPFFASQPIESEEQYRDRFRTALLTNGRAVSPTDFENLARSYSAGIRYVQVSLPRTDTGAIRVIVAGESVGSSEKGFNTTLLHELETFLQNTATGCQEVQVVPARERRFLIEAAVGEMKEETEEVTAKFLNNRFGPGQTGSRSFGSTLSRKDILTLLEPSAGLGSIYGLTLRDAATGTGEECVMLKDDEYPVFRIRFVKRSPM